MIRMNNFRAEPVALQQATLEACARVVQSGWYILGKELQEFELAWAETCGANYGIGVGNGMDAIEIILRSLSIGSGDEVITTPMTAFATVLAILRAGATPVFADIAADSGLLAVESAQRCLSSKTKAVLLVHLYGQIRDMTAWQTFCDQAGIQLIEDCAQAHLATWQGTVAGGFGIAGAYSFYPTKNLGALGDGGMIVTNESRVAEKSQRLRNYGQSLRYHHPEQGLNSRLDEIQAAILKVRLNYLAAFTARRQEIAQAYQVGISNPCLRLLAPPQEAKAHVYHLYVVLCTQRDALAAHLRAQQIETLIHYPIPIHQQEPCIGLRHDPQGLPQSEAHAGTCLSLPCHPQMSDADVQHVIASVNSFRV